MTTTGVFALILIAIGVGGFILFSKMKVQHQIKEPENNSNKISNTNNSSDNDRINELENRLKDMEKKFLEFQIEYYKKESSKV